MIKKDLAYDLMEKKEKSSNEIEQKQNFEKEPTRTENLISQIKTKSSKQKTSNAYVDNIRKIENGIMFDVIKQNDEIIKDLFIPKEEIFSQKSQLAQEHLMETERKQRKMIEFFIIYPAAILSSVIIIHGFMSILPVVQKILSNY